MATSINFHYHWNITKSFQITDVWQRKGFSIWKEESLIKSPKLFMDCEGVVDDLIKKVNAEKSPNKLWKENMAYSTSWSVPPKLYHGSDLWGTSCHHVGYRSNVSSINYSKGKYWKLMTPIKKALQNWKLSLLLVFHL